MYPGGRHPTPLQAGQPFKFSILEICDRIKEEFQFLQAQYHSLKLECEKLVSEKTEMQRHYVMYYEMSYGLNIEMHKQAEIVKRLSAICAQIIPFLTQEHQQQVLQAVERAKQVTMGELNSIVGQQQLQHLSHHAPPIPLTPHPSSMQPSSLTGVGSASGLLALSGALMAQSQLAAKEDRVVQDGENREHTPSRVNVHLRGLLAKGSQEASKGMPEVSAPLQGESNSSPFCSGIPSTRGREPLPPKAAVAQVVQIAGWILDAGWEAANSTGRTLLERKHVWHCFAARLLSPPAHSPSSSPLRLRVFLLPLRRACRTRSGWAAQA
ncbi:transducin-like enhancer protein 2 isoform X3 [Apteryx rowi]|uniref:transducin-like enhancer protein 2 isoform X3 n=1 Tax=Apteryx rowi TaxID=308060 RepID=UPI000E1C7A7B|nr:transducin-like enhancer protein 2 isoform X3 [Apteryx rowi]